MDDVTVTPKDAAAALAEASSRALQVRRADRYLLWMLVGLAVVYLGAAAAFSVSPSPHRGSTYSGVVILGMLIAAIAFVVIVGLRIKAYSRGGILWYFATLIVFNLWNAAVTSVSIITVWWATGQPTYHFGLSEAVAVIPLLLGILMLARRRA